MEKLPFDLLALLLASSMTASPPPLTGSIIISCINSRGIERLAQLAVLLEKSRLPQKMYKTVGRERLREEKRKRERKKSGRSWGSRVDGRAVQWEEPTEGGRTNGLAPAPRVMM